MKFHAHSNLKMSVSIAALACAALVAGCGNSDSTSGAASSLADAGAHWQTFERYCTDCHNNADLAGGFAFDRLGPDAIADNAELFETVVRKLRGGLMPPPGEPQPEQADRVELVAFVESTLDSALQTNAHPESIVLHRLNRKEYGNAIADLLAVDIDPGMLLPQDEVEEGFDNVASALQVSPSFIEQYVIAARSIAVQAVGRPDARAGSETYFAPPGAQQTHVAGLPLGTRGGMLIEHYFPSNGEYAVNIADMASHIWGNDMEFENTVIVTYDGKLIYETVVGGEADVKAYDQIQDGVMEDINGRLKNIRFEATAGPHEVGVAFRRRSFALSDDRLPVYTPGGGQDRIYRVSAVEVSGPFGAEGLAPMPSREKIFTCHPERGDDELICAEEIIERLGRQAFRRPFTEEDMSEIREYYSDGFASGGFEEGIRSALTGILASPYFLYRAERIPEGLAPGENYRVSDLELASKLSFFLWNTIPDEELLELAIAGDLGRPEVLDAQVERMLEDPRSSEVIASDFIFQWLDLQRLDEVAPDLEIFPYASGRSDPRDNYVRELTLFARSIFEEDRSVVDLLSANHTFLNESTALLYDITGVKGDRFRRVELQDSTRWGLLGKGAVLMAAAYPNRTSPVLRGAFVLEHLLGTPPAAPPPTVEALNENDIGTTKALSVRELIAKHRENPSCYSCHAVMDPLGFALENFDAVGTWRDRDRFAGTAIDTSAELPDGTPINGPDDLREALLERSEQFVQTFTEGLLMYALGRKVEYFDMPYVRRIVRDAAQDDYRYSTIVKAIVTSEPFLNRRVPEDDSDPAREVTALNR